VAVATVRSVCTVACLGSAISACRRAISSFTSNLRRFNATIWRLSVDGCARASTISACSALMAPFQFRKMRCSGHIGRSPQSDRGRFFSRALWHGPAMPSTRPTICHVIREPPMCLATGEAAGANLYEALRF
jgi:hypothetical protein